MSQQSNPNCYGEVREHASFEDEVEEMESLPFRLRLRRRNEEQALVDQEIQGYDR